MVIFTTTEMLCANQQNHELRHDLNELMLVILQQSDQMNANAGLSIHYCAACLSHSPTNAHYFDENGRFMYEALWSSTMTASADFSTSNLLMHRICMPWPSSGARQVVSPAPQLVAVCAHVMGILPLVNVI